jgi:hypothetical protein
MNYEVWISDISFPLFVFHFVVGAARCVAAFQFGCLENGRIGPGLSVRLSAEFIAD